MTAATVWEVFARKAYEEQPWIEMIIVPRLAIREAIRS